MLPGKQATYQPNVHTPAAHIKLQAMSEFGIIKELFRNADAHVRSNKFQKCDLVHAHCYLLRKPPKCTVLQLSSVDSLISAVISNQ